MPTPVARLTKTFLDRVEAAGLTDAGVAAALGISRQYYGQVKAGVEAPSVRLMAAAVEAGLAETFGDVAERVTDAERNAA